MPYRSLPVRDFALLVLLATLWGAAYTFIRIGVTTIPPVTLIAGRTLLAGLVLVGILGVRRIALPRDLRLWGRFAVQAALNSVIPFTLIAWAERTTPASLAVILNSTTPIFAFLMTAALTRHEAVSGTKLLGVGLGLVGICLTIGIDALNGLGRDVGGQLAIVLASVCYGAAAIFGKGFRHLDPMLPAAGSLIVGAAVLLPVSLATEAPWTLAPSRESLFALAALAILSTSLAFVLYFRLLTTLGTVGTTAQAYLRVPIGVAIGVFFLGETLSTTAWIGFVCVIAGVAAMTLPSRTTARA
jgi:drug/metabolite transporter (DMT)-like permease